MWAARRIGGAGVIFALFLVLLAPPALARNRDSGISREGFKPVSIPTRQLSGTVSPTAPNYKIGAQDVLNVDVFQVPDLTKTVQVDSSGMVLLPLVGQVKAAGRTTSELSSDLSAAYARQYVKDPLVTVTVKESQSQRVTVDGAVNQPGIYALTGPTTLMQAIALAKGPDPKLANLKKVAVFRMVDNQRMAAVFDLQAIRAGKKEDPEVLANDTIVVDTSSGKSFFHDLVSALPLISIFSAF